MPNLRTLCVRDGRCRGNQSPGCLRGVAEQLTDSRARRGSVVVDCRSVSFAERPAQSVRKPLGSTTLI